MKQTISKEVALFLLKNEIINDDKAIIVCKGFATEDDDFVEVLPEDIESLKEDKLYQDFEIWMK